MQFYWEHRPIVESLFRQVILREQLITLGLNC